MEKRKQMFCKENSSKVGDYFSLQLRGPHMSTVLFHPSPEKETGCIYSWRNERTIQNLDRHAQLTWNLVILSSFFWGRAESWEGKGRRRKKSH